MNIYFSHSKSDYNSEYEAICLNKLKEMFCNVDIYNPNQVTGLKESNSKEYWNAMKVFFKEIDKCDILCAFKERKSGKWTDGVRKEIEYAYGRRIMVIKFNRVEE